MSCPCLCLSDHELDPGPEALCRACVDIAGLILHIMYIGYDNCCQANSFVFFDFSRRYKDFYQIINKNRVFITLDQHFYQVEAHHFQIILVKVLLVTDIPGKRQDHG